MESNKQGVLDPGQTTCANLSWPAQTRKWSNDSSSRRKFMAGLPRICDIERQKWCCNSDLLLNIRVLAVIECSALRSRDRSSSIDRGWGGWVKPSSTPVDLFSNACHCSLLESFFFFLKIILKKQNKSSMIIFFILFRDLKIFDSIRFDDFFLASILRN